jgi:hypothetical protein
MAREGRLRRWIYGAAAVVAVLISGPAIPLELAMWLSGELLLYLEVIAGVWLASRGASWTSLRAWLHSRPAQVRQLTRTKWRRVRPSLLSWLHWTFVYS